MRAVKMSGFQGGKDFFAQSVLLGGQRQTWRYRVLVCWLQSKFNFPSLAWQYMDKRKTRPRRLRPCEKSAPGWEIELDSHGKPSTLPSGSSWEVESVLITLAQIPSSHGSRNWKIRMLLAAVGMFWTTKFELTPRWEAAALWTVETWRGNSCVRKWSHSSCSITFPPDWGYLSPG